MWVVFVNVGLKVMGCDGVILGMNRDERGNY